MDQIYVDESGSMCKNPTEIRNNYFYICLVRVNDNHRANARFKKFVSRNMEQLKKDDEEHYKREISKGNLKPSSMFVNDKFNELKGSVMSKDTKIRFLKHMCVDGLVEVCLIKVDNMSVEKRLYENTARAFNFILKLALIKCSKNWLNREIYLHLDNRNVKTNTVHVLKEYLCTELITNENVYDQIEAEYYQSENCKFVQIADVFANVYYSSQFSESNEYLDLLNEFRLNGVVKVEYLFPIYPPKSRNYRKRYNRRKFNKI